MTGKAGGEAGADDLDPAPAEHMRPGGPDPAGAQARCDAATGDLSYLRAVVDRRLGLLVPSTNLHPAALHAAMRHILLAPGKRLRPLLALCVARQLDGPEQAALDFGCAVEMVHAASLIMDDLPCMDDAALRRARPTTHVQFGEDVALLAAIALLSRAFGVVADTTGADAAARLDGVATLSAAVGSLGLSGGQLDDLRPAATRSARASEDVNHRKTGVLFAAAAEMAGRAAGVDAERMGALATFAQHVGGAYQILDDILDATGSSDTLGKQVGQDAGKATVLAALGSPGARALLQEHLARAAEASRRIGPNDAGHQPLISFLSTAFGALAAPGGDRP